MATPSIAYPQGISPDLVSKLTEASTGSTTFGSKVDSGMGTLTSVTSDVSVVLADIRTHNQGRSITALSGFWDGPGAIGSGGLNSNGVISDASRVINFLDSLSGSMPGVSGNITDQTSTIQSGLSAIASVQNNPHKQWTVSEANSLQSQINGMVSALESINTSLRSTASPIELPASSNKDVAGVTSAAGVAPSQPVVIK